jgi:hypothetical protein
MGIDAARSMDEIRARLAIRLNLARPSHVWMPFIGTPVKPGCIRCPGGSPFKNDRMSHLFIIEEEL